MAGVFISYRRSDSAGHTGRLAADLSECLEEQQLFRDIEAIEAGEDFVEALNRAVAQCSVMLVIIGPTWAKAETADGKRRLHQPGDFVRIEIETALAGQVRVIPVLVGEAQMPQAEDLPESMQPLLRRNAFMISDRRWQYDVDQLLNILEKIPGIASRRKNEGGVQAPSILAPPAKTKMAMWKKVAMGVGAVLLIVVLGVIGSEDGSEPPAASSSAAGKQGSNAAAQPTNPSPAAETVAPNFVGLWKTNEGLFYYFEQDGDTLIAVSGESIDPSKAADPADPQKAPTEAGIELLGNATAEGRTLHVTLTDTFSKEVETLRLTMAADGRTLEGDVRAGTDGEPAKITARRQ